MDIAEARDILAEHRRRACIGKGRYHSKARAKAAATTVRVKGEAFGSGRMTVYRCIHCGGWHAGHRPWSGQLAKLRKARRIVEQEEGPKVWATWTS